MEERRPDEIDAATQEELEARQEQVNMEYKSRLGDREEESRQRSQMKKGSLVDEIRSLADRYMIPAQQAFFGALFLFGGALGVFHYAMDGGDRGWLIVAALSAIAYRMPKPTRDGDA